MRLRNKKARKVYTLGEDVHITHTEGGRIEVEIVLESGGFAREYFDSLAEFNDEWEDVKEPLIKNEKIRKAVRAWAKAMRIDAVDYKQGEYGAVFYSDDNVDGYGYRIEFDQYLDLKDGCNSIVVLCGEEE